MEHNGEPGESSEMLARSTASAEAFKELALALRTSVETMHGVRELQAELVKTLKRQDRSELVVQSTNALNDTFRSLATTQRQLLERLDGSSGSGGASGSGGRLVPLMMLGLLIVFLGGIFIVLDVLEQMKAERPDVATIVNQASARTLEAYEAGKEEGVSDSERSREQLETEVEQRVARERTLQQRLAEEEAAVNEMQSALRAKEARVENLTKQLRTAHNEMLARKVAEDELTEATRKLAVAEPKMRDLEMELEAEKAEVSRLRRRLGQDALGIPTEQPQEAAPVPETPVRRPDGVERDPTLLGKIRDRLNQMLDASSRGRGEVWQIQGVSGVTRDRLDGVTWRRYDRRTGRLIEQVATPEVRFWVDRNNRSVEMEFQGGPAGRQRHEVAGGEMTRLWSQSGLLFLHFR